MVVLPSNLPDWASLPLIALGGILVAGVIRLASPRRSPPASAVPPALNSPLEAAIQRARDDLARHFAARLGFALRTTSHGAVEIDPANLVIWFITDRDAQRDRLLALPDFQTTCREHLAAAGYPPQAVPLAHFSAESEETVSRDWGGNWWHYFK